MKYDIDVRQFSRDGSGHTLVTTINREVHRATLAWPNLTWPGATGPIAPRNFYWVNFRGVRWALRETDRLESKDDNPEIFLPDEVELWPILKRLKGIQDVNLTIGAQVSAVRDGNWVSATVYRLPKQQHPLVQFEDRHIGVRPPDEIRGVNER